MILKRYSSWSFVALRGSKRCSPLPFVDRPNHDLEEVFFVVLRGPSWMKRCSPLPFVDRPNHDLEEVFFVVLCGPSWIKKCSPPPFVDRPNHDTAKVFFVPSVVHSWPFVDIKSVLPRPSWTDQIMIPQRFSSWSFVVLRGPSWIKKGFSPALPGQTKS